MLPKEFQETIEISVLVFWECDRMHYGNDVNSACEWCFGKSEDPDECKILKVFYGSDP